MKKIAANRNYRMIKIAQEADWSKMDLYSAPPVGVPGDMKIVEAPDGSYAVVGLDSPLKEIPVYPQPDNVNWSEVNLYSAPPMGVPDDMRTVHAPDGQFAVITR